MSQISPPIRIVLLAAVAFMAAWFFFLRPGTEAVTPTPAPGSGFGTAVSGAKDAAATANAAAAKSSAQSADPAAATTTGTATKTGGATAPAGAKAVAAKKSEAPLGLPADVAKAVAKNKTLVMLFWNKRAFDDQAVRHELRKIDRHKGQVKIHVASIDDVARYAPITRGVNLEQSPTVVVIKGNSADALVGYVDRGTIDQTVSDVMRSKAG
jgi:hypothetical protein